MTELFAGIAIIGKDEPHPKMTADSLGQNKRRAIAVLHINKASEIISKIAFIQPYFGLGSTKNRLI